jgi:tetratricopeptide (TPR) repeat protein
MFDVSETLSEEVTRRLGHFVRLYPQNALANYYYALSLWKGKRGPDPQADLNRIESLLKKTIELDHGMAEGHFQLGVFYSNQQRIAEAIEQYEIAIKIQPEFANAHYRLGQAYQRTGQKAQAQKHLEIFQRLHSAGRPEDKHVIFTVNEIPR